MEKVKKWGRRKGQREKEGSDIHWWPERAKSPANAHASRLPEQLLPSAFGACGSEGS